ncbi:MAG TPA: DUF4142 domain-containing protein [Azospirillaceae bacterium]|nr:DUF4142 domain-containing protein [Azospirillaceae bacterium]
MRTIALAAVAALMLSGTALAQQPNQGSQNNDLKLPDNAAAGGAPAQAGIIVSEADKTFVTKAAQGNMAELATSKLALEKAQNPEVKKFAQQMIDDHTKATENLTKITQRYDIDLPGSMGEKHQGMLDKLKNASARDFDREYVTGQVDAHKEQVGLFQAQADQPGKETPLNAFAKETLPKLQAHLDHVTQLQSRITETASSR